MKRSETAILIKQDGTIQTVTPKNGLDFSLDELNKLVGGLIDIVYFPNEDDLIMVVNDEGMYTKKPNAIGCVYLTLHYGKECIIYGDVLICKDEMVK